ncbi:S24/S26 family peptidase [candidate division CSSED10-310 bacterium]|uniref:S24/S26 family peptidase n=1 Tax=candidate division CSSED10-310 bacterium TaxID=2855610 RepID=A0ABV6YSF8_UNCC1
MESADKKSIYEHLLQTDFTRLVITVEGHSMVPTLKPGDKLMVQRGLYLPGDILTFMVENRLMVHRLLGWWFSRGTWFLVTKGDNLQGVDTLVSRDRVLGKVRFWERNSHSYKENILDRLIHLFRNIGGYCVARFKIKAH